MGIEEGLAEANAFDLRDQPLALFRFDQEVIHVFIVDHAVDRHVQRDPLRDLELVVRLDFLDFRKGPHAELEQIADARGRAHAHGVQPEPAVGGDRQPSQF